MNCAAGERVSLLAYYLPHYLFLKDQKVSYPEKVIKLSPHSAEVLQCINEDYQEKVINGFAFRQSPQAWLVSQYKNANYQPKQLTTSQKVEQDNQVVLKREIREKERQIYELRDAMANDESFLDMDEAPQFREFLLEKKGAFYLEHKHWPQRSGADWAVFEQECQRLLPAAKEEKRAAIGKIREQIVELSKEIHELKSQSVDTGGGSW